MLQFQNKCKQSNAELQKMKSLDENKDEDPIKLEILDEPNVQPEISRNDLMESNNENAYLPPKVDVSLRKNYLNRITYRPQTSSIPKTPCYICGKVITARELKYHINRHNGT